ncbi:hypothetical protein F2P81_019580 [Scophthalmus maximus]|uniref:Uncharacterized protein n=1 Tax=Scophthalmus maximus TaxID=52904 RepID=A0A6A4S2B8_SCOMX|nr:hypothetical protein F2P81_019580 [Scophthalmus maximus]
MMRLKSTGGRRFAEQAERICGKRYPRHHYRKILHMNVLETKHEATFIKLNSDPYMESGFMETYGTQHLRLRYIIQAWLLIDSPISDLVGCIRPSHCNVIPVDKLCMSKERTKNPIAVLRNYSLSYYHGGRIQMVFIPVHFVRREVLWSPSAATASQASHIHIERKCLIFMTGTVVSLSTTKHQQCNT